MNARQGAARAAAHLTVFTALAFALLTGAVTAAGPAWAHAARTGSDPADNAELAQQPARVSATFNEDMQPEFAAMTVVGPDGGQWAQGQPTVAGQVVSIGVRPGSPAGAYTVNYRATSADGHVVTGSWSYRVTSPAPSPAPGAGPATPAAAPAPAAAPGSGGGVPVWPFAVAAVVIIAGGALWAVRRRS
jgi:copper resistance protein C